MQNNLPKGYPREFSSPTHKKAVQLLSTLKDDLDIRSVKRSAVDYLSLVVRDVIDGIKTNQKHVLILKTKFKEDEVEGIAYQLGSFLNFSLNNSISLTRTSALLGQAVLSEKEDPKQLIRERNIVRVKVGLELLDGVRKMGLISFRREAVDVTPQMLDKDVKAAKGRAPYKVKVRDEVFAFKLGLAFYFPDRDRPIYTEPLKDRPADWKGFYHPIMGELVRNAVDGAKDKFSPNKTPNVFKFMNKIKDVPFRVNSDLLDIFSQCKDDLMFTRKDKNLKPKQRSSIKSQQDEIFRIADSIRGNEFYLASFLDFRGRFYYANSYFHPQGNKLARSLFLFSEKKRIGVSGWEGLLRNATSEFGHGKLSPQKKLDFATTNLPDWLKWAESPLDYKGKKDDAGDIIEFGWQVVDNPFAFLGLIREIHRAYTSESKFDYESNQPLFTDASNSGTQFLSALGKDPVGGKLSNLTESDVVGDVYQFVADKVWAKYTYTDEERDLFNVVNSSLVTFQEDMDRAYSEKRWDYLKEIRKHYSAYYTANKDTIKLCAKVFWHKHKSKGRKLCKRPVMTIPYSAGVRTIARAINEDWSSEPDMKGLTGTYCFVLAEDILREYSTTLEVTTNLMDLFIKLGLRQYKLKSDLTFSLPLSGFVFTQNARKDKVERVKLNRRGQKLRLNVCVGQDEKIDYEGVKSASSPNVIHALDADFMSHTVRKADYPMMVVHDSFATYPGAYEELNKDVRNHFVEMFGVDVLKHITTQCHCEDLYDEFIKGDLDINGILTNPYAFDC